MERRAAMDLPYNCGVNLTFVKDSAQKGRKQAQPARDGSATFLGSGTPQEVALAKSRPFLKGGVTA